MRAIRNQGFNNLTYNASGLMASSTWSFLGEGTSDSIGKYTRTISFTTLCRDLNYNLATCPASATDIYSKKVTVTVSWTTSFGKTNSVVRSAYLTDWQGKYFKQSDWYDGNGQATWSFISKYDSDSANLDSTSTPGQITLKNTNGTYPGSGWLISSAFNMATSGVAQAIEWDQNVADCTPACTVQLQVRTAPDSAGAPGSWTNWYGAGGANTYFTTSTGSLLPTALLGNGLNQWVAYKATLTGNGSVTPVLQEVRIDYR